MNKIGICDLCGNEREVTRMWHKLLDGTNDYLYICVTCPTDENWWDDDQAKLRRRHRKEII